MNTKRVNNEFHRLDVKLPIDVYNQVSEIAVNSFGAKIHHISSKPEITPTLIYLLEMGIQAFSEPIKKYDTDNDTDNIPITDNWVKELIKDELIPIQSKLNELSELVYRLTYTDNKPIGVENIAVAMTERILGNITDTNTDKLTDTLEVDTDKDTDSYTDNELIEVGSLTDNLTDNDTDKLPLSECPILPLNEDLRVNIPKVEISPNNNDIQLIETEKDISSIGSLTDAIDNVILPELAKGNDNHSAIARMLYGKYYASNKGNSTNWQGSLVQRAIDSRNEGKA
jgi:hypothetical protein